MKIKTLIANFFLTLLLVTASLVAIYTFGFFIGLGVTTAFRFIERVG